MDIVTPGIGLIFWTTLIFLVVVVFLRAIAWKPILSALDEREKGIEDALAQADKARAEMAKLQSDNEKIMRETRAEREVMLSEARKTAQGILEEAQEKAKAEASRALESAKRDIEREKNAALNEVKTKVADLTIEMTEKVLRRELNNESDHRTLIDQYIKDFQAN